MASNERTGYMNPMFGRASARIETCKQTNEMAAGQESSEKLDVDGTESSLEW